MDIYFRTRKLQKQCSKQREMVKRWGPDIAKELQRRLREIQATKNIGELQKIPQARCHQLKGRRDNQFAVDLKHPYRLIFEPCQDPVPLNEDGGFDLWNITAVNIVEVVDYHGD